MVEYIPIEEADFDPEKHVLPEVRWSCRKGDVVGLTSGSLPNSFFATPLSHQSDYWTVERVGIVLEEAEWPDTVRAYISDSQSECESCKEMFWVIERKHD